MESIPFLGKNGYVHPTPAKSGVNFLPIIFFLMVAIGAAYYFYQENKKEKERKQEEELARQVALNNSPDDPTINPDNPPVFLPIM